MKSNRKRRDVDVADDMMDYDYTQGLDEVYAALESLQEELNLMKDPVGTMENPARSCKDLWLCHPDFPNGNYHIDPNGGSPRDGVEVYCDLEQEGVTCIAPSIQRKSMSRFKKSQPGDWFSEDPKYGFRFDYNVSIPQFKFLRLLSATASQRFTYHCQNSVGWYDKENDNYDKAVILRGHNDETLTYKEDPDPFEIQLEMFTDDCTRGKGTGKVVLDLTTRDVDFLPFVDYKSEDFGERNQKHGFEIGPVCFQG